ncbi:MAG: DUF1207 domain-containing protein, partial [Chrysiogenales bacterium]
MARHLTAGGRDRLRLSVPLSALIIALWLCVPGHTAAFPDDAPTPENDRHSYHNGPPQLAHPDSTGDGWLPGTRLMPAFLADPRRTAFSGGIRYHDDAFNDYRRRDGVNSRVLGRDGMFGAVSLGSRLPIYRWDLPAGELQFNIEGGLWALFAFKKQTGWLGDASTLLNTDYYFAFPTTYRIGTVALQFRFWHMSSHLGDEFILLYPEIPRRNVSNECADLFVSYEPIPQARFYGGAGTVVHS